MCSLVILAAEAEEVKPKGIEKHGTKCESELFSACSLRTYCTGPPCAPAGKQWLQELNGIELNPSSSHFISF